MRDVVFVIIHTPNDKHRLIQRMPATKDHDEYELDRGLWDTHALAETAMDRIVNPKKSYYDKDGEPTL